MAEAHLDNCVYANGYHHGQGSGLMSAPEPPRGRRTKARLARH